MQSTEFSFRALERPDFALLGAWLARPHVRKWWKHDPSPEAVEKDFAEGVDGIDPVEYFIVSFAGREMGFMQRYVMADNPEWLSALSVVQCAPDALGFDYFIAEPDMIGRGIGTAMIGEFIARTWDRHPEATTIIVDVDPNNPASWRALEKNGFVRVWEGELEIDDPDDQGPTVVFRLSRDSRARAVPASIATPMPTPTVTPIA